MAIRQTILQTKRSLTPNQNLPVASIIKQGEAVVNLSDGILFFSGVTGGSYTPSNNGTSGYFEVGSNLYDLNLRNKIIGYEGQTDLSGKFLSGTTSGFTLANISDIAGVDTNTYVTGFTWNPNQLTISRNDGLTDLVVSLDTFSGLTVTGDVDIQGNISNSTGDVTIQDNLVINGNLTVTGTTSGIDHNGLDNLQGGTSGEYYHTTQNIHDALTGSTNPSSGNPFATISDIAAASGDTQQVKVSGNDSTPGFLEDKLSGGTNVTLTTLNDGGNEVVLIDVTVPVDTNTYVTGNTNTTSSTNSSDSYTTDLTYAGEVIPTYSLTLENTFVTGGTLNGSDLVLHKNDGTNTTNIDLSSLDVNDTFVTGFTYDNSNTFTVSLNDGTDLSASINTVTGLTFSNLTDGRVVYVGTGGILTDESGFEYNDTTNLLTVGDLNVTNTLGNPASIGQGGLVIGSGGSPGGFPGVGDLTIHGSLVIFGTGTTIDTNELFVEDPTITLNFNPTGNTSTTSLGSGFLIQDGSGVTIESGRTDVFLAIARMDTFTGGDATEYDTGGVGPTNRSWFTELNDIVIRNTNTNSGAPDGKRVLAEDDVLDGGLY